MKRSEVIGLLDSVGMTLDFIDKVEIKNQDTGDLVGTIGEETITGMQTALAHCKHVLDGTYEEDNPIAFVNHMLNLHASATFGLHPAGCNGVEYVDAKDAKQAETMSEGE